MYILLEGVKCVVLNNVMSVKGLKGLQLLLNGLAADRACPLVGAEKVYV